MGEDSGVGHRVQRPGVVTSLGPVCLVPPPYSDVRTHRGGLPQDLRPHLGRCGSVHPEPTGGSSTLRGVEVGVILSGVDDESRGTSERDVGSGTTSLWTGRFSPSRCLTGAEGFRKEILVGLVRGGVGPTPRRRPSKEVLVHFDSSSPRTDVPPYKDDSHETSSKGVSVLTHTETPRTRPQGLSVVLNSSQPFPPFPRDRYRTLHVFSTPVPLDASGRQVRRSIGCPTVGPDRREEPPLYQGNSSSPLGISRFSEAPASSVLWRSDSRDDRTSSRGHVGVGDLYRRVPPPTLVSGPYTTRTERCPPFFGRDTNVARSLGTRLFRRGRTNTIVASTVPPHFTPYLDLLRLKVMVTSVSIGTTDSREGRTRKVSHPW